MSYYCVLRQRNPDTNPGYIPCPDYEARNCEGCATPDELFGDSEQLDDSIILNSVSIYDEEEIHTNCTVQILRNSVTGDVSVGWWPNEEEDDG